MAYASRSLNKVKSHYLAHKLVFLALKWAVVEKFHKYLYRFNLWCAHSNNNPLTYILTTAKLDAASHHWVTSLANYNFRLHYRAGKPDIDAEALSRVSWPECMPDSSGTHLKVTVTVVWVVQEAALKGPISPIEGLQLWSAHLGYSPGQSAGCLYDPRGLASSPRSGSCPESSNC